MTSRTRYGTVIAAFVVVAGVSLALLIPFASESEVAANATAQTPTEPIDPGRVFNRLEDEMAEAHQAYVTARRAERDDGPPAVPFVDRRSGILRRMDRLAMDHAASSDGARIALQTFVWSWMLDLDLDRLLDRFKLIVSHHADAEGLEEPLGLIPASHKATGTPAQWIEQLERLGKATGKAEHRALARFTTGQVHLVHDEFKAARAAFEQVLKDHPDVSHAAAAKGYIYEIDHLQVGMPAPDFTTRTLDGEEISLKDLRGKVVLLDFWATWCPSCIAEVPRLQELVSHLKGKPFEILAVSVDDELAEVRQTVEMFRFPGIHTWDVLGRENPVANLYNAQRFPTWYLIDARGVIRARDPFHDKLRPAVEALLKEVADGDAAETAAEG